MWARRRACLRELGVPSYHHELVRRALAAASAAPKHAPALRALLAALAGSGQIHAGEPAHGCAAAGRPCTLRIMQVNGHSASLQGSRAYM